jgi:hypothetical protein
MRQPSNQAVARDLQSPTQNFALLDSGFCPVCLFAQSTVFGCLNAYRLTHLGLSLVVFLRLLCEC